MTDVIWDQSVIHKIIIRISGLLPGLLPFEFLTFAAKGGGEHVKIQKYGADWQLERSDCNYYRNEGSYRFLDNITRLYFPPF